MDKNTPTSLLRFDYRVSVFKTGLSQAPDSVWGKETEPEGEGSRSNSLRLPLPAPTGSFRSWILVSCTGTLKNDMDCQDSRLQLCGFSVSISPLKNDDLFSDATLNVLLNKLQHNVCNFECKIIFPRSDFYGLCFNIS